MFSHLAKNCANVEMDISWVENLEAFFYGFVAKVKEIVFDLKGFLQVTES